MLEEGTWNWAIDMMKQGYRITRSRWSGPAYYDLVINDGHVCFTGKINGPHSPLYMEKLSRYYLNNYRSLFDWKLAAPLTFNLGDI